MYLDLKIYILCVLLDLVINWCAFMKIPIINYCRVQVLTR